MDNLFTKAIVLKIQRFDGFVKDTNTGNETKIENSCKVFILGNLMTEEDTRVSQDNKNIFEQFGHQIDEIKLDYPVYEALKSSEFPFRADLTLKSSGKNYLVTKVENVKPIKF